MELPFSERLQQKVRYYWWLHFTDGGGRILLEPFVLLLRIHFVVVVLELTLTSGIDWMNFSVGIGVEKHSSASHRYAVTRWQCRGALKYPGVSGLGVMVQHQVRVLWLNDMYCTASGQTCCQYLDDAGSFHESVFCWGKSCCVGGRSSSGTTGIGLFTTRGSPFPQAQNRHRGQLNYGISVCVSAMTVYLTWSGCGLNPTGKSHSYLAHFSSLSWAYPRFVADVILCP